MSLCPSCDHPMSDDDSHYCVECEERTHDSCDAGHFDDVGEWVHDECAKIPAASPGSVKHPSVPAERRSTGSADKE